MIVRWDSAPASLSIPQLGLVSVVVFCLDRGIPGPQTTKQDAQPPMYKPRCTRPYQTRPYFHHFSTVDFFSFPKLSRSQDEEGLHDITIQVALEHLQALERAPGYVVRVPGRSGSLVDPDGLPLEVVSAGEDGDGLCTDHR